MDAKDVFKEISPLPDYVERDIYYYYDESTVLQLMEIYHKKKQNETIKEGLKKLHNAVEHVETGFFDND